MLLVVKKIMLNQYCYGPQNSLILITTREHTNMLFFPIQQLIFTVNML